MSEPRVPEIGPRIRRERTSRDVTIRALAREIGVSASLISQIETGKSQPSVSTLYAITTALGLPLEQLFDAEPDGAAASGSVPLGGHDGTGMNYLGADRDRALGPHVGPDERELLTLDSGVTWQRLGQVPNRHVDFLLVTYEPGGSSSRNGELMRHTGTEYGYLISGDLVLTLGFDEHRLGPGDAVCFESTTPHGYRNHGTEPAVGVWFVLER
ncbi:MAG TPA: cupin domain-containing protein [Nocardioidaceae bacterium]|nr:cupin domain-containing protein [Nocardioidaceae bacterium]